MSSSHPNFLLVASLHAEAPVDQPVRGHDVDVANKCGLLPVVIDVLSCFHQGSSCSGDGEEDKSSASSESASDKQAVRVVHVL